MIFIGLFLRIKKVYYLVFGKYYLFLFLKIEVVWARDVVLCLIELGFWKRNEKIFKIWVIWG